MKTLLIRSNSRVVQQVPSGSENTLALTLYLNVNTIYLIQTIISINEATAPILTLRTMPTFPISPINEAQNVEMRRPPPLTLHIITETMEKFYTSNDTP